MAASAGCAPSRALSPSCVNWPCAPAGTPPCSRGAQASRRRSSAGSRLCQRRWIASIVSSSANSIPPASSTAAGCTRIFDRMQTDLSPEFRNTSAGREAEAILRKCVHCGFCTATCPTYQILGDELDSPRGRIYLIKQVLEGAAPTRKTQLHLDRCLTCRNCETRCPSGVEYGKLVDIGRKIVEERVPREAADKALRWTLKEGLPSPLFGSAMKLGQAMRGLLPQMLKDKVPARQDAGRWPAREHARKVLMLAGCVQPSMMPNINSATARVLDAAGIQTLVAAQAGCCGAVKFHLNDQEGGLAQMRANIDAWWPYIVSGRVEAIVMNASGCGVTVREYGHHLQHDPAYAAKAR